MIQKRDVWYFPKGISQVVSSQGNFPMCQLPKCAISQTATSKVFPSLSHQPLSYSSRSAQPIQPVLSPVLGPHCILRRLRRSNLTFGIGKLPLGKLYDVWEVATWIIVTLEVALRKMGLENT